MSCFCFVWVFVCLVFYCRIITFVCAKGKAELRCLLHLVLNSKGSAFGTALVANPETIG